MLLALAITGAQFGLTACNDSASFTLTVLGAGTGSGAVASTGGGAIACTVLAGQTSGSCSESIDEDETRALTAAPAPGSTFDGWQGACSGNGACSVSMSENRTLTATFSLAPSVLALVQAPGSAVDNQPFGTQPHVQVLDNAGRPLAVPGIAVRAEILSGAGSLIGTNTVSTTAAGVALWTDLGLDAAAPPAPFVVRFVLVSDPSINLDSPAFSVAAAAVLTVQLGGQTGFDLDPGNGTISGSGINCGSAGSTCSTSVAVGTVITLLGTPGENSFFLQWEGPCPSGQNPTCVVTLDGPVTVTGFFALEGYSFTVAVEGTGADGTVESSASGGPATFSECQLTAGVQSGQCGGFQSYGTRSVMVTARAGTGSVFVGWSGDCTATGTDCVIAPTPGGSRSVKATFARP